MNYYLLNSVPADIVRVYVPCRGQFLVGTLREIPGEQPLSADGLSRACYNGTLDLIDVQSWSIRYSIRGQCPVSVENILAKYTVDHVQQTWEPDASVYSFSLLMDDPTQREQLFAELKSMIDQHGGFIDWHECIQKGTNPQPCVIAETYTK